MTPKPKETTVNAEQTDIDKAGPFRRCIFSGETLPRAQMIRFVVGPDQTVFPDILGRLPGRGIWLSADRIGIKTACERNLFSRAARQNVHAESGLVDRVEELLAQRCTEILALARRAGQAVAGYVKVEGWVKANRASIVLVAADGSGNGTEKMRRLAGELPIVTTMTGREIGRSFGRDWIVHAAMTPGGLADSFANAAAKLGGIRQRPENEEENE